MASASCQSLSLHPTLPSGGAAEASGEVSNSAATIGPARGEDQLKRQRKEVSPLPEAKAGSGPAMEKANGVGERPALLVMGLRRRHAQPHGQAPVGGDAWSSADATFYGDGGGGDASGCVFAPARPPPQRAHRWPPHAVNIRPPAARPPPAALRGAPSPTGCGPHGTPSAGRSMPAPTSSSPSWAGLPTVSAASTTWSYSTTPRSTTASSPDPSGGRRAACVPAARSRTLSACPPPCPAAHARGQSAACGRHGRGRVTTVRVASTSCRDYRQQCRGQRGHVAVEERLPSSLSLPRFLDGSSSAGALRAQFSLAEFNPSVSYNADNPSPAKGDVIFTNDVSFQDTARW
ncbi:hypothetical protein BS78_K122200 [Paspalum vaginatum]|uniref:Uncharacterized protein n=1 Tax=Paspalum vaginatum TaxID=158149 RepID=A0A9W7XCD1_9POAL|nr:hypothetical protein BS78_K122200 [Paspalum vaginatum]